MSKIIFSIFAIILLSAVVIIKKPHARSLSSQAWGKSRSDVAVRIIEREAAHGQVALTGEIQTELDSITIEWRLPEGVTLLEGKMTEVIERKEGEEIIRSHATFSVPETLEKPQLIFFAYIDRNGHRTGQSRVFNLKKTDAQKHHVEKIKQMMIDRGVTPRE